MEPLRNQEGFCETPPPLRPRSAYPRRRLDPGRALRDFSYFSYCPPISQCWQRTGLIAHKWA